MCAVQKELIKINREGGWTSGLRGRVLIITLTRSPPQTLLLCCSHYLIATTMQSVITKSAEALGRCGKPSFFFDRVKNDASRPVPHETKKAHKRLIDVQTELL